MPSTAPPIDNRRYDDVVAQTEQLAQQFAGWGAQDVAATIEALRGQTLAETIVDSAGAVVAAWGAVIDDVLAERILAHRAPPATVKVRAPADLGGTLIRVFGRMLEQTIARLNRVPDKNFVAFLDLIGTRLQPPQPARVPLTFGLAEGSTADALVPARTQVAAPATDGGDEVIFETERDLLAIRARLAAVVVHEPAADRYADYTAAANGALDTAFPAFAGRNESPIEHCLFLAHAYFEIPGSKTIILAIDATAGSPLTNMPLEWSYWDGTAWVELTGAGPQGRRLSDAEPFKFQLPDLPVPEPLTLNGRTERWIRIKFLGTRDGFGQISDWRPTNIPQIRRITASLQSSASSLMPLQALLNGAPLDFSKDVYPFGERPRIGDTLYLQLPELSFRGGTNVYITITLNAAAPLSPSSDLAVAWEALSGSTWRKLLSGYPSSTPSAAFAANGNFSFVVPGLMEPGEVNGVQGRWIRARIVSGNYGTEATYRAATAEEKRAAPGVPYVPVLASFAPPLVSTMRIDYDFILADTSHFLAALAYNDFRYTSRIDELYNDTDAGFVPFTLSAETQPALYLGFDQPLPNRALALYLDVDPIRSDELAHRDASGPPARIVWEYAVDDGWRRLGARDETRALAERGLVTFLGPLDLIRRSEFGQSWYWLRARWEAGQFPAPPRLRRVQTNTTWASNTLTLHDDVLGSSDGSPSQTFRAVHTPVLPGQLLEVWERELPPPDLRTTLGADAIAPQYDEAGVFLGAWVRWQEVSDFYKSGARDRHYVLDRLTGEVRFGDGQRGIIPPLGRNSIRMALYRTGGGARGNVGSGQIAELKTTIPYIERVVNGSAAAGGADAETLEHARERGPLLLRHNDRAVTAQDIEDLASAASAEVARVLALTPRFDPFELPWLTAEAAATPDGAVPAPTWSSAGAQDTTRHREVLGTSTGDSPQAVDPLAGAVELIVVPRDDVDQPLPSLELLDRVAAHLEARLPVTAALRVSGPEWIKVQVFAEVVPLALDGADGVRLAVNGALRHFLNPLTGGDGSGWDWGRFPQRSDLYALIEGVPGVDYVRTLRTEPPDLATVLRDVVAPHRFARCFLVYSGDHQIVVVADEE